jgi:hypothetical protein
MVLTDLLGGVIVDGRTDGYCDSDDFKTELADCLACALEYDIWQYYGSSVSEAAEECGLDATPSEATTTTTSDSTTETTMETAASAVESDVTTDAAISATRTTATSTSVPSSNGVRISSRPSSSLASATPFRSSVSSLLLIELVHSTES